MKFVYVVSFFFTSKFAAFLPTLVCLESPTGAPEDLKALKSLFTWLDLAPLENVARVLETAFFPQWHSALKQWLRTKGCNFSEVLQWYQERVAKLEGWKLEELAVF